MISQARLDDLEQNLNQFADRKLVGELLAEIRALRLQVQLLEQALLEQPDIDTGVSLYYRPPDSDRIVPMIPRAAVPRIHAEALNLAAAELEAEKVAGTQQWKTWAASWLRRRAQRVTGQ